jgi:hypothetical protein
VIEMLLVANTPDFRWRVRFNMNEAEWTVIDKRSADRAVLVHEKSQLRMAGETSNCETVYCFYTDSLDIITAALDVVCIVPHSIPNVTAISGEH